MADRRLTAASPAAGQLSIADQSAQSLFSARVPPAAILALIVAVTCIAYLPALGGEMLWDDDGHITKPELRSAEGLFRIWFWPGNHATQQYYPLLHSLFWLEHRLWGDWMPGYHVANLLLHVTAACLVYAVVRKLQIPGALLAAGVFALHPVQVETVAWISEQKNTLSTVFYLGAMLSYLHFDDNRQVKWYLLALGLFLLGLFSKTVVATLPAALLVIFWWQRGRNSLAAGPDDPPRISWWRDVLPLVPFFVFGAIGGMITASVEQELIGSELEPFQLSVAQRILLAGRAIWFYLASLFWPVHLIFIYPRWRLDPSQLWQWLFPFGVLVALAVCWAVRQRTRAPLAAALLFVGTLFPALGFINVYPFRYSFVADHFQYLASLGIIVPLSAAVAASVRCRSENARLGAAVAGALLLGLLAALTWQQSTMYGNTTKLYETTLAKNPDCWMAHNNLGLILLRQDALPVATSHFERALELNPEFREARSNLGIALRKAGKTDEAIKELRRALAMNPSFGQAHYNLGAALLYGGQSLEAIQELREAIRLKPDLAEAHSNLGAALFNTGQPQEAIQHFEETLRLQPDFPKAHINLGRALFSTGRAAEALVQFQQAVQQTPNDADAYNDLGAVLTSLGRTSDAIEPLQRAVQLRPDFFAAHNNLGKALLNVGRPQEAIAHFEQWLRASSDSVDAWSNLATANALANHTQGALAAGQKAAELARTQGRTELAQQLDEWLTSVRAGVSPSLPDLPPSALPPPTP